MITFSKPRTLLPGRILQRFQPGLVLVSASYVPAATRYFASLQGGQFWYHPTTFYANLGFSASSRVYERNRNSSFRRQNISARL